MEKNNVHTYREAVRQRLGVFGVTESEAVKKILDSLEHAKWLEKVYLLGTEDVMKRLGDTITARDIPKDDEWTRPQFFSHSEAIEVLRLFGSENFWSEFEVADFVKLKHVRSSQNLAASYVGYITVVRDKKLLPWVQDKEGAANFINNLNHSAEAVSRLLASANLEQIINMLTPQNFASMCNDFEDHQLVIEYPEICREIHEIKFYDMTYEERIVELNRAFYRLGLNGFDQKLIEEMEMVLYKRYLAQKLVSGDAFEEEISGWRAAGESYLGKQKLTGLVKASFADQKPSIKKQLGDQGLRMDEEKFLSKWRARMESADIDWLESADNPLLGTVPLIGYEIEFQLTKKIQVYALEIANKMCFKKGYGGGTTVIESSPGPFASHKTAAMTFLSFVSSDILDLDRLYGQSVHLNLDLKHPLGAVSLMRWLQLTGLAYQPEYGREGKLAGTYTQADANYHDLRVVEKCDHKSAYIECKEFTLMNPRDFVRFLRYSQMLATGVNLLHKATGIAKGRVPVDRNSSKVTDPFEQKDMDSLALAVEMSDLNEYEKKIVRIYMDGLGDLATSLSSRGVDSFLDSKVPTNVANVVIDEIISVLPDNSARSTNEALAKQIGGGFSVDERRYPNMVALARGVAARVTHGVEKTLVEMEKAMAKELSGAVANKDSDEVWAVAARYQSLLKLDKMDIHQKRARIKRLVKRYKSLGWV